MRALFIMVWVLAAGSSYAQSTDPADAEEKTGEAGEEEAQPADPGPAGTFDELYNRQPGPDDSPRAKSESSADPAPNSGSTSDAEPGSSQTESGRAAEDGETKEPRVRTYRPREDRDPSVEPLPAAQAPGVFGRYFPLTTYDELDPRSGEIQPYFFLGGLLPAGQIWLPLLMSAEGVPDGFIGGAALLMLVHLAPHLAVLSSLPCGLLLLAVPAVGPVLFVGVFLLNLANIGAFMANNFYFMPVAIVNEYDRAVRLQATTTQVQPLRGDERMRF